MTDLVALTTFERRLQRLLEPVIYDQGFMLVRLRFGGSRKKSLQIMAEKTDGTMTVGDCATLSESLSPILDIEDIIALDYSLEVSSPGIDRPLTKLEHFERWIGFEAKLELFDILDGRRRFKGIIQKVIGTTIHLAIDDETTAIKFSLISNARLTLSDKLLQFTAATPTQIS